MIMKIRSIRRPPHRTSSRITEPSNVFDSKWLAAMRILLFILVSWFAQGEALRIAPAHGLIRSKTATVATTLVVGRLHRIFTRSSFRDRGSINVSASDGADEQNEASEKTSSVSSATFNLIKACVGSGVLALPSGIAVMSDMPKAAIPASILVLAIGMLSAYTFYSLGRLCKENHSESLGDLWQESMGSSWVVNLTTMIVTLCVCLTYSMILGDFLSPIVQQPRNACIIAVTAACLYPLALLPSLDALAPVSFVGVIGSFVTCAVMFYQWKFSSSYRLPSGYFLASLARDKQPTFGVRGTSSNPLSALVLVSMAATSYLCHFSAPEFLASLKGCLKDYRAVTFMGFAGVGIINVAIMCAGYLTFGGNSSGLILNSYAQKDVLAGVCRLLMALSVVGSFPFQLNGARNALYNTFFSKKPSKRLDHAVTVALLCGVTIPALSLRNAGIVVSINGALMGSAIAYIFPALLMLKQKKHRFFGTFERIGNGLVLAWGIMAAIVGVSVSLLSVYSPQVLL